jgi:WD40 repeat protein
VAVLRGHSNRVVDVAFSPEGRRVVKASYDDTARIFACEVCVPIEQLLGLAETRTVEPLTDAERRRFLGTR